MTRGVVPSATCVLSLGTPMCHPPSPACHPRPCPDPRPRSTLETPPEPRQRADLQAQVAGHRGAAASRWGGAGGALPQTPAQKYRLIYLSAPMLHAYRLVYPISEHAPPQISEYEQP